jgi:hypothetical protein
MVLSLFSANLISVFYVWFSHLRLILYAKAREFSCSVAFLTSIVFLIAVFRRLDVAICTLAAFVSPL